MGDTCFSVKDDCDAPPAPAPNPNGNGQVDGMPWDMSEKGVAAHEAGVQSAERSMFWDAVSCVPGGSFIGAAVSTAEGEVSAYQGDNAAAAGHYADAATDVATSVVPGYATFAADADAYFKRKDGAMPDQAPTFSENVQQKMWEHFAE